jgi:hypothetical protein
MNYRTQLFRRGLASGALIAVAGLAGLTAPAGAQSLGSAENFAVLGASTVTNTGCDRHQRQRGREPGPSIIGFPPGIVMNGALHAADGRANPRRQPILPLPTRRSLAWLRLRQTT